MKKVLSVLLMLVSFYSNAQEYKLEEKSVTGIFEANGKTKAELLSAINKWVSINYNSGKTVTQLSDTEAGNIVIKGQNEVFRINTLKKFFYTNMNAFPSNILVNLNHLIEINVKDNKYRIVYKITDYVPTPSALNYYLEKEVFNCLNFINSNEASIFSFNEKMDAVLKTGLKGKSKRELVLAETKPAINELNSNLINQIKLIMLSINSSVSGEKANTW